MPTIAPERPEIDVEPGFSGFVALAARAGLLLEAFQKRIVRMVLEAEREALILLPRGNGRPACSRSSPCITCSRSRTPRSSSARARATRCDVVATEGE